MDVEGFINAETSSTYKQWQATHKSASYEEEEHVIDIIMSQPFKDWLSANPNGTVDQYIAYCNQTNAYYNSPEYMLEQLQASVENLREDIRTIEDEKSQLTEELECVRESNARNTTFAICTSITTIIFLATTIFLLIKLRHRK
jgi:hypothetical protein